ncbi:hypothetical protein WJX81_006530 [Elliptochloris bilobata]|uniref:BRCA1-associated protein n=1 Tax=Elliptochloris bilobata TaxID=381761 RepID=A0AAW1RUH8_9CHLO
MYAVRVTGSSVAETLSVQASRLAEQLISDQVLTGEPRPPVPDAELGEINFSAGNPCVEHLTGTVHLYRQVLSREEAESISPGSLPEGRCERLCILALPADMGVADLCAFVGGYLPRVREMRMVRREDGRSLCLVLLCFDNQASADGFYADYNNKPFSSLEPDMVCRLVFVRDIVVSGNGTLPLPPAGQTELPTCPVCLERLDEHISGVVTTVCNHRFHNECLQRWGDTSCPVCRYCVNATGNTSHCAICGTSQDLWICLICGHVGCGRYRAGHAADHWRAAGHAYALELEAQRVWDYAADGYVHRLIQSKTDGKLVEVPRPAPPSSSRAMPPESAEAAAPVDAGLEEALVASKLDHLATEYSHLLVSQLDAQRAYFEGLLQRQASEAEACSSEAQATAERGTAAAEAARAEAAQAERARRAAERKLGEVTKKLEETRKERDFLKELNGSLLRNQADLQKGLADARVQLESVTAAKQAAVSDLEEQVRDLMVYIEVGRTVSSNGDLQDAQVLPVPAPAPTPVHSRRSARR